MLYLDLYLQNVEGDFSNHLLSPFGFLGSPTKIDYRTKLGTLIPTYLLEDVVKLIWTSPSSQRDRVVSFFQTSEGDESQVGDKGDTS